MGAAAHWIKTAGILAPLVIGEFVKDADKRWRYIRLASVATALVSLHVHRAHPEGAGIGPITIPDRFDSVVLAADLTFGIRTVRSDYAALLVAGRHGANYYILQVVREKLDYPQTIAAIRSLVERYKPTRVLIEQAASGPAVLQALQREIPGIIGVKPGSDSKIAKFSACAAIIEAGQVILPHPSLFSWVDSVLDEFATIPNSRHDDVADALQLTLNEGIRHGAGRQWNAGTDHMMQ
jgi:predicted phage terminase large subunit-like protein